MTWRRAATLVSLAATQRRRVGWAQACQRLRLASFSIFLYLVSGTTATNTRRRARMARTEQHAASPAGSGTKDTSAQREGVKDVFCFVPNMIGFTRAVLLLSAMWFVRSNWRACLVCYCLSFGLDVIDGPAARSLNQVSRFGAALDMLCDKASTPTLLFALSQRHPQLAWLFVSCALLDIVSHYFLLQVTPLLGTKSHKDGAGLCGSGTPGAWLARLFYEWKPFFAWTCLGHEIFVVAAYWLSHSPAAGPALLGAAWQPLWSVVQSVDCTGVLQVLIGDGGSTALHLLPLVGLLAFPSFVAKTTVHLAQLSCSACALARIDVRERATQADR